MSTDTTKKLTKEMLCNYVDLTCEIDEVREKIARCEREIDKINELGTVVDSVSGGYGGKQHFKIEGIPLPELMALKKRLVKLKNRLSRKEYDLLDMTIEIEHRIMDIDDVKIRRVIELKYIKGKTWNEVAIALGQNVSEDSIRMAFNRFLMKEE